LQLITTADQTPGPPLARSLVESVILLQLSHTISQVSQKTFPHGLQSSTLLPGEKFDPEIVTVSLQQGLQGIGAAHTPQILGGQHLGAQQGGGQHDGAT
jgi:hypothetical protein